MRSAYTSAMRLAEKAEVGSIAFPCISTGVYGYPKAEACAIAVQAVSDWIAGCTNCLETWSFAATVPRRGVSKATCAGRLARTQTWFRSRNGECKLQSWGHDCASSSTRGELANADRPVEALAFQLDAPVQPVVTIGACVLVAAGTTTLPRCFPDARLGRGCLFGVVAGDLQSRSIRASAQSFKNARTALEVREALMSNAPGRLAVIIQWVLLPSFSAWRGGAATSSPEPSAGTHCSWPFAILWH